MTWTTTSPGDSGTHGWAMANVVGVPSAGGSTRTTVELTSSSTRATPFSSETEDWTSTCSPTVTVEPLGGHPLTAGSGPFTLVDEHYMMELDDTGADVYVTTTSEHGTQPGGWTRTEGEGRVCVLTPGHNVEVWGHPSFQALLTNGLRWCSKTLERED